MRFTLTRGMAVLAAAALALTAGATTAVAGSSHHHPAPSTRFYVPKAPDGSRQQIAQLRSHGDRADAKLLATMVSTPQAVWFTGGSPRQVARDVKEVVRKAAATRSIPTLVAYNLPYRDCGQYSAGGAAGTDAYEAWIAAFAGALGHSTAIVILEPDGLGLIPNYVSALDGSSNCTLPIDPSVPAGNAATPANRFTQLNFAVDALATDSHASVYLDATHTAWQNVGESADRLVKAGVERSAGFFVNLSNYEYTPNLTQYGTWVSQCLAYATEVVPGDYNGCPNQYWNGGPTNGWNGVALNSFGVWSDTAPSADLDTASINARYAGMLGTVQPTAHFVIDTSRNGQGPWKASASYADAQDWCNPPGRGLGETPAADPVPGRPLLDAYLWVKTPGQSDGQCTRGTGGTTDPEWGGIVDPAAGAWFPQQALELAQLSVPPLS
ncbi:MAG: glycoside hydrolase family 6 protein [Cellulomonas sp.]